MKNSLEPWKPRTPEPCAPMVRLLHGHLLRPMLRTTMHSVCYLRAEAGLRDGCFHKGEARGTWAGGPSYLLSEVPQSVFHGSGCTEGCLACWDKWGQCLNIPYLRKNKLTDIWLSLSCPIANKTAVNSHHVLLLNIQKYE